MFIQRRLYSSSAAGNRFYKITLKRSTIGLPKDYRAAAHSLGLFRLHKPVYKPINASTAGVILKLKELVKVETVDRIPTKEELDALAPPRGYKVIGTKL